MARLMFQARLAVLAAGPATPTLSLSGGDYRPLTEEES